jgi:hypothetical protein
LTAAKSGVIFTGEHEGSDDANVHGPVDARNAQGDHAVCCRLIRSLRRR